MNYSAATSYISMTSFGACTNSMRAPSPPFPSFGFGCMKHMSWPLAPGLIPPGVNLYPLSVRPSTAAGRSSIQRPMWFSGGGLTEGFFDGSRGCIRSISTANDGEGAHV